MPAALHNSAEMQFRFRCYRTPCPYKGDCTYFSIPVGGDRSINAVWTYEHPYPAVGSVKDHLAFYPDRVDAIEERQEN